MLTKKEAAKYLGIGERTLHDLIHRDEGDPKKVPAYKAGRRIVFYESELDKYLHENCKL